jgi:hypothetical protein
VWELRRAVTRSHLRRYTIVQMTCSSRFAAVSRIRHFEGLLITPNFTPRGFSPSIHSRFRQRAYSSDSHLPPFDPSISYRATAPPNSSWTYGSGLNDAFPPTEWPRDADRKTWDVSSLDMKACYQLLTSAIVPRPIAFVSTLSKEGVPNLAPFRWVFLPLY